MLRITKTPKIVSVKWYTKGEMDPSYNGTDVDSFVIIPGVTHYQHIYSSQKYLIFDSKTSYMAVERTMFNPDDNSVICAKGKIYQTVPSSEFEAKTGLVFWVSSEIEENIPLTLKLYDKYFTTIDEMRNNKINEILK